jgi:hypothetical protein
MEAELTLGIIHFVPHLFDANFGRIVTRTICPAHIRPPD